MSIVGLKAPATPALPRHEQARRAVRWLLLGVFLTLGGITLALQLSLEARAPHAESCPAASASLPLAAQPRACREAGSLALELAGSTSAVAALLRPSCADLAQPPSLTERIDIEACIGQQRLLLSRLDARVFIPFYASFALLLAAWTWLDAPPSHQRRARWAAAALGLTTALLVVADGLENEAALHVLTQAQAQAQSLHVMNRPATDVLQQLAIDARWLSIRKWAWAVLWGTAIVWALALSRHPRATADSSAVTVGGLLALISAALGTVLLATGTVLAWGEPSDWERPALQAGFGLLALAGLFVALAVWRAER